MKVLDLKDFSDLLESYETLTRGKNIILSINFMRLGLPNFPIDLIPKLAYELLKAKSISIQTYSPIDRKNNIPRFSRFNTSVSKGLSSISIHAFRKYAMCRLLSPTHSFVTLGDVPNIYNHVFTSAFGNNSTFDYYLSCNSLWLNLGSRLAETGTFLHHVEQKNLERLDYLNNYKFKLVVYPDKEEKLCAVIEYEYSSRKPDCRRQNWGILEECDELKSCIDNSKKSSIYDLEELLKVGSMKLRDDQYYFLS